MIGRLSATSTAVAVLMTLVLCAATQLTLSTTSQFVAKRAPTTSAPYPTVREEVRILARFPSGPYIMGPPVLTDGGRDALTFLEYNSPGVGGCLYYLITEANLSTGIVRFGPRVTCYAELFESGTGQAYMLRPDRGRTELLMMDAALVPKEVAVIQKVSYGIGPVPTKNEVWLGMSDRIELLDLANGRGLRSLPMPHDARGPAEGIAIADPDGTLYVSYCGSHHGPILCADLAQVSPINGHVLAERYLDCASAWVVATPNGVFVGERNMGTGAWEKIYSAKGLRLLSPRYDMGGGQPLTLLVAGNISWSSSLLGGLRCFWISKRDTLGLETVTFKSWNYVWGYLIGVQASTGGLLLVGTAAGMKVGVNGVFSISTPKQCQQAS